MVTFWTNKMLILLIAIAKLQIYNFTFYIGVKCGSFLEGNNIEWMFENGVDENIWTRK